MKAYDYTEKAKHEQAKQRNLAAINAQLTRHERVIRLTLILVVTLAGLALALLVIHLINHSN
ncbi:hypothetical protein [Microvirga tunisiensis]|jgi:cell division protein FtsL|uniref:Uncharacterized protein n=1 Tax=Microvirga tunisiensis TaxID=2108360 RepID=A0A5N7MXK7_9HYPH|nr:hypothetical protein [Microvirga tunisiensis]MPR13362.1 hypothetical protein [Microvirga tunisiensis]MPR31681.1 hypothetical protein [Microvirga tunisiensis]